MSARALWHQLAFASYFLTIFYIEIYVNISLKSKFFSFFLFFDHDFIIYIDFTRITASNTTCIDVTN